MRGPQAGRSRRGMAATAVAWRLTTDRFVEYCIVLAADGRSIARRATSHMAKRMSRRSIIRAAAAVLTATAAVAGGVLALHGVQQALAAPSGLVAAYGFDEGSGTTVTDASGNGNNGTISERDVVDGGQVRQGVAVQRHQRAGHDSRCGVAAPDDRDDAGGVGQPVDGQRQLARRDLQGQRQLLPRGDVVERLESGRRA